MLVRACRWQPLADFSSAHGTAHGTAHFAGCPFSGRRLSNAISLARVKQAGLQVSSIFAAGQSFRACDWAWPRRPLMNPVSPIPLTHRPSPFSCESSAQRSSSAMHLASISSRRAFHRSEKLRLHCVAACSSEMLCRFSASFSRRP